MPRVDAVVNKTTTALVVVAAVAISAAWYELQDARKARAALAEANAAGDGLRGQLEEERKKSAAAVAGNAIFLKEIQSLKAKAASNPADGTTAPTPNIHDAVQARFNRAQQMARNGQYEEALKEFLWCYDEGMPSDIRFVGVRDSFLLSAIANLGANYPPAIEALKARRDQAAASFMSGIGGNPVAMDFSALNKVLGDDRQTLEVYDQLPPNDSRRNAMALTVYDQLLTAQRYADAAQAKPYPQMISRFELTIQDRPAIANSTRPETLQALLRQSAVETAAKDIETLAGAGDLADARLFTQRVLAYDASASTMARLQAHANRAGHPELLASPPQP
jgi:hypothetical protein